MVAGAAEAAPPDRTAVDRRHIPNTLTGLRLLLAVGLFGCVALHQWLAGLALFGAAALTDWLDGHLARRWGVVTKLGRVFDPLVDKVLVLGTVAVLLDVRETPLPGQAGWSGWMLAVLLTRELLVTGLRDHLEAEGVSFGADRLGKAKMVVQSVALAWVLLALAWATARPVPGWVPVVRDVLNLGAVALTAASGVAYGVRVARRPAR